ncbi:aminoglycoside phosphotransferase family protein [Streptomyces sp. PTM05]|uniref:Aminoglycoside phosphotransferase family protein n=1 Tax=Streptantibioticus parmotrematis TaxID=2873249 RepID=A0ABS7R5G0_9ACTN|nr:aminoglycoside phosphotransferase family protein [Streptantibioticus parmotrematis]MBY8889262.1 aminoglycoside phosphotransferase family protein [Streptantibioticus parmotrematis]
MTSYAHRQGEEGSVLDADQCAELISSTVPEIVVGLWSLDEVAVTSVEDHAGTWLMSVRAGLTDHVVGVSRAQDLVIKFGHRKEGWHADRASRLLHAEGLGQPPNMVVRSLGVGSGGVLVTEAATGRPWADCLAGPDAGRTADAVARFLLALQNADASLPLPAGEQSRTTMEISALLSLAGRELPRVSGYLEELAGRLERALVPTAGEAPVASHGDFHPRNVLVDWSSSTDQPCVTAIDLDHAGRREPAFDVGYALWQVLVTAHHLGLEVEQAAPAAHRLWTSYRDGGGLATEERVTVQMIRAFVQVTHFEHLGFGGAPLASLLEWARIAARISRHGPDILANPDIGAGRDSAGAR